MITSIDMAHAWEHHIYEWTRAAKEADIKAFSIDMTRVEMESSTRQEWAPRPDPSPLWHELIASARCTLGPSASERDVREYAIRLDWGLTAHGAMPPMSETEWAELRGLTASWLWRKGMSEKGMEKFIADSPGEFYPEDSSAGKVSAGVLIELVRTAYEKARIASAGAPFLPVDAPVGRWRTIEDDRNDLRLERGEDVVPAMDFIEMLGAHGVDLALLRTERLAEPYAYVPWAVHFAQALTELGPEATEREVNMRAAVIHYAPPPPARLPWEECLINARVTLDEKASERSVYEHAARLHLNLKPHGGDTLSLADWVDRQATYLADGALFQLHPGFADARAELLAAHSYLDVPKEKLKAEIIAASATKQAARDAEYSVKNHAWWEQRQAWIAELKQAMSEPNAPPIEHFWRMACEYRKSGVWSQQSSDQK